MTRIRVLSAILQASRPLLLAVFVLTALPACSLLTIESPAEPLSERDLKARVLTREYAISYASTIAAAANRIIASNESPIVRMNALRWKIDSTSKVLLASTHMSPSMALVDTWALAAQTDDYMQSALAPRLSEAERTIATATTAALREQIEVAARRVFTADEYRRLQALVADHVRGFPVTRIDGARVPVTNHPSIEDYDDILALSTVGTAAEAMSDMADRMRMYTIVLQYSTRWQLELLAMESGVGSDEVTTSLKRLDQHFADLARFASSSPFIARRATADLEEALNSGTENIQESTLLLMTALKAEREALFDELDGQWRFLAEELDTQRAATAADLERVAGKLTEELWTNVNALTSKLMAFMFIGLALLLTVPFAAGYFVGRARSAA